jgi:MoaE-MoaD fusion protein
MNVRVQLFAILRERAGSASIELELASGATVADALAALERSPALAGLLERLPVRMAVNREYATRQTPLSPDDELALIPPVSGGGQLVEADVHVRVTEDKLSIDALTRLVGRQSAGAIVVFCGVTREVERLEYEAYSEMAEEQMLRIAHDCRERHRLHAVAIEHRIGPVALGESSVIVAVSASHRDEAFAGAREAIDTIKARAPIWKREISLDRSARWIPGNESWVP